MDMRKSNKQFRILGQISSGNHGSYKCADVYISRANLISNGVNCNIFSLRFNQRTSNTAHGRDYIVKQERSL